MKELPHSLEGYTHACLFGGPGNRTHMTLFHEEKIYFEAGILYFGNSGDCTDDNSIYWEMGEGYQGFAKGA